MKRKSTNRIIKPQKRSRSKKWYKKLNFKGKKVKRNKEIKEINNLKILEIITKLQLSFILIIVVLVIFNKFNFLESFIKDEISVFGTTENNDLINTEDIELEHDVQPVDIITTENVEYIEKERLSEANNAVVSYLRGNTFDEIFNTNYVVDSRAGVVNSLFDFETFEKKDITLTDKNLDEPKVLIFHTHASEQYIDSKDINEGVYLLGETLKEELEKNYGIKTIHVKDRFDLVEGRAQIMGAYDRMQPVINKVLEENPSIEVVIDIHRDGLPGDMKQVVEIDGEKHAPLMFVNGISSFNNKGTIEPLSNLYNPNLSDNLTFSYRIKQASDKAYKGLFKDIYINAYRYSLFMKPKSLLLEVGAQNNTVEESVNSVKKFSRVLGESLIYND